MIETGRLLVLYGSQTFTAQEIAERVWRITKALGFRGPVQAMNDYPIARLIHEETILFICSTTGVGEEPDNMTKFWKFLLRKNLPSNSLARVKFGVIGLGDSSYAKFNFAAKKLYKRLIQLGAEPLLEMACCDYQHDLSHDGVMIPWLKNFFTKLKEYFPSIPTDDVKNVFIPRWKVSLIKANTELGRIDRNKDIYFSHGKTDGLVMATEFVVEQNYRTTVKSHFQDVRLLTLKTKNGTHLNYKPGDVFNIRPRNSKQDIDDLFGIFETHNIDIKPHYKLLVEECHEGKYLSSSMKL